MCLIGAVGGLFNIILTTIVVYCMYMAFTDSPFWVFVAIGFFLTDCVVFMVTTAAFTEMKR